MRFGQATGTNASHPFKLNHVNLLCLGVKANTSFEFNCSLETQYHWNHVLYISPNRVTSKGKSVEEVCEGKFVSFVFFYL